MEEGIPPCPQKMDERSTEGRRKSGPIETARQDQPHILEIIVSLYAFDLIELDGDDLRREPIERRRVLLIRLLAKAPLVGLQVNDHIVEPGDVVFRHACQLGFEGIVSKRLGSPYVSGRSRHWIKNKNPQHPAVKREAEEDWSKRRWK